MFMYLNYLSNFKTFFLSFTLLFFINTLAAQGTLEVSGNNNVISSGDITPSVFDNTDFGNVEVGSTKNNTFVLDNTAGGGSPI